ncbi:hypothetical protein CWB59_12565 [Pseudoalteromonas sp. S326]|uniref:hypothetical protein n=1 Tax=Pseudoalteromonas sp. S326 TaxID=579533 RepID=UPI00110BB077|nr:hypothetical protein [Pseudoalteromonas sp. S326]TMO16745.1 hypothetical protein CWB59_12565 [Pseudoalteromonas sp. S326]
MITAAELANATTRLPDPETFRYNSIQIMLHNVLEPIASDKGKTTYLEQSTVTFVKRSIFGIDTWVVEGMDINNAHR